MIGIVSLLQSKAFKWFVGILLVVAAIWLCLRELNSWEQRLIEQGYQKAMTEQVLAQRDALTTIATAVNEFGKKTSATADAVEANERAFDSHVVDILKAIKQRPLIVKTEAGDCRLTKDGAKSWNELQKAVQRP